MSRKMINWLKKCVPCFTLEGSKVEPIGETSTVRDEGRCILNPLTLPDNDNSSLWSYDHIRGRGCSCEVASAKSYNSPTSCTFGIESIDGAIVVCVCDSHGSSHECAAFVQDGMTKNIIDEAEGIVAMLSDDVLIRAFMRTETNWQDVVERQFFQNPLIAASGTSCLVGVILGENLFLANVGDSRAIIAKVDENNNTVPDQLTIDDNINDPTVRATILIDHPDEPDFLVEDGEGIYLIKGRIQLTKSIGDMYLKSRDFNIDGEPNYRLNTLLPRAALSAIPSTIIRAMHEEDRFIVFGSKELWNIINHQEALFIVQTYPPRNIAATLIRHALAIVAQRHNMTYSELQLISYGNVIYHSDLAVAVIFLHEAGEDIGLGVDVGSFSTEFGNHFEAGSASTEVTSYFTALEDWEDEDLIDPEMPEDWEDEDLIDPEMPGLEDV